MKSGPRGGGKGSCVVLRDLLVETAADLLSSHYGTDKSVNNRLLPKFQSKYLKQFELFSIRSKTVIEVAFFPQAGCFTSSEFLGHDLRARLHASRYL